MQDDTMLGMSLSPPPRPVILDLDPGHDDAVNILLALSSPELEVLGLCTVFGNVGLERTTRNALITRELIRADVPVYAGADRPLALAYVGWRVLRPFFVKETGCGKGCGCAPEPVSLAKKAVQAFQRQR